jgi:hypothetical protein
MFYHRQQFRIICNFNVFTPLETIGVHASVIKRPGGLLRSACQSFATDISTYYYFFSNNKQTIMPMPSRHLSTMFMEINNHQPKSCEQDDASASSTMTVEVRSSTKQEDSSNDNDAANTNKTTRRSVRFCLSKNESFSNTFMCKEDLLELWYTISEFKHFRSFTMYAAKEITKVEARNKSPLSYERVMTHTYLACCKATSEQGNVLTADEFKHLVRWAEIATSRLGLEKWSIQSLGQDRSYRRSLMMDMVLEAQNTHRDNFNMEYFVADCCTTISRPMRLFSRTLAEAQLVAARNYLS